MAVVIFQLYDSVTICLHCQRNIVLSLPIINQAHKTENIKMFVLHIGVYILGLSKEDKAMSGLGVKFIKK